MKMINRLLLLLIICSCGLPPKENNVYQITNKSEEVVEIIDPCGAETEHDEIILRYADKLLVIFYNESTASSTDERLILLEKDKIYTTQDGTACTYKVIEQNNIYVIQPL